MAAVIIRFKENLFIDKIKIIYTGDLVVEGISEYFRRSNNGLLLFEGRIYIPKGI
jgi:hypothetical protein